jgi:hypothetical protein
MSGSSVNNMFSFLELWTKAPYLAIIRAFLAASVVVSVDTRATSNLYWPSDMARACVSFTVEFRALLQGT